MKWSVQENDTPLIPVPVGNAGLPAQALAQITASGYPKDNIKVQGRRIESVPWFPYGFVAGITGETPVVSMKMDNNSQVHLPSSPLTRPLTIAAGDVALYNPDNSFNNFVLRKSGGLSMTLASETDFKQAIPFQQVDMTPSDLTLSFQRTVIGNQTDDILTIIADAMQVLTDAVIQELSGNDVMSQATKDAAQLVKARALKLRNG